MAKPVLLPGPNNYHLVVAREHLHVAHSSQYDDKKKTTKNPSQVGICGNLMQAADARENDRMCCKQLSAGRQQRVQSNNRVGNRVVASRNHNAARIPLPPACLDRVAKSTKSSSVLEYIVKLPSFKWSHAHECTIKAQDYSSIPHTPTRMRRDAQIGEKRYTWKSKARRQPCARSEAMAASSADSDIDTKHSVDQSRSLCSQIRAREFKGDLGHHVSLLSNQRP